MTVVTIASFLQAAAHPAHDVRRMVMSMFAGRGGVVPRTATFTDLKVTQRGAGANMSVDVAEGSCLVTGTESTYQGLYHAENQGVQNVTIAAADATNARRDMIVARIKDTEYGVAVTDAFSIETVAGTPSGTPADPTIPENCIVLARVAVAASATSITNANITDLRNGYPAVTGSAVIGNQVKAVALGGVVPCLAAFRPTKALYAGQVIYETDTGFLLVYNGTTWVPTTASGRVYVAAGSVVTGASIVGVTMSSTDFLHGGMTRATTGSTGLTVPVSGVYQVNGEVKMVPPASNGGFAAALLRNNVAVAYGEQVATVASVYQGRTVNDLVVCSAGDIIGLGYFWDGPSTTMQCDGPGQSNYLSACLVGP
jgi:hypothetical protein